MWIASMRWIHRHIFDGIFELFAMFSMMIFSRIFNRKSSWISIRFNLIDFIWLFLKKKKQKHFNSSIKWTKTKQNEIHLNLIRQFKHGIDALQRNTHSACRRDIQFHTKKCQMIIVHNIFRWSKRFSNESCQMNLFTVQIRHIQETFKTVIADLSQTSNQDHLSSAFFADRNRRFIQTFKNRMQLNSLYLQNADARRRVQCEVSQAKF